MRQQGLELYLLAIACWAPPPSLAFRRFGRRISDSVGFDPAQQMMTLGYQAVNDLASGVVGIGDKVKRRRDGDETEQDEHFVEQSAAVAIGPDQAFMDACCERHGEEAVRRADEDADRLQGMPHDVFRLGVGVRLLMQQLDGRHFLAALGTLDAVADQDQPAVDAQCRWEQPQHHRCPQRGEPVELDAGAVKVGEQPVIERGAQI